MYLVLDTGRPPELIMRNELALQHLLPPRHFLALTSTGLHVIVKLRPVDILRQILTSSRGNDTKELKVYHPSLNVISYIFFFNSSN
jgi:hypothetical protein